MFVFSLNESGLFSYLREFIVNFLRPYKRCFYDSKEEINRDFFLDSPEIGSVQLKNFKTVLISLVICGLFIIILFAWHIVKQKKIPKFPSCLTGKFHLKDEKVATN